MKTAIVCDWLVTYAGSEKVLAEILHCFPDADLFAVVDFLPSKDRGFLGGRSVKTTFIQGLPFAKKYYRHYLPLMPLAIEQLDLSHYDLVISSSHAVAKGVLTGPNQTHVSYVHSPMRYAWDLQHQYLKESGLDSGIKGYMAQYLLHRLRLWDQRTAHGVDHFIANSGYIAKRIWKNYRREADVIYPPIDLSRFTLHTNKENFYLAASRLVPYKKMDLIVDSFAHMPDKKLIVIGDGPDMQKIKSKATSNIHILGFQSTDTLIYHLQRAKALVFAAEEDFGLIPVEAQACGTPVIAFEKGGALETIKGLNEKKLQEEKPTGLFFAEQSVAAIVNAIKQFEKNYHHFDPEVSHQHANQFTPESFRNQFKNTVEKALCASE